LIQKIINVIYRYPKAKYKSVKRFGGYFSYWKMLRGQKQMQEAAKKLPPILSVADGLAIYFLTGKKYLYQTLFCIQSLAKVSATGFKFTLVDDGSFDEQLINQVKIQLPGAVIVTREMIERHIDQAIPQNEYPVLHHKRKVYPHIKKLTDIHTIPGDDWKLVLDSDMLFWNEPEAIINWLKHPTVPIYMQDCQNSYGYSAQLMEQLCGNKIPQLLNVGTIGLSSAAINWHNLETWTKELEEKEGSSYYLEQALTAMLLAGVEAVVLPANNYIVNPTSTEIDDCKAILHHYVDLSKEGYLKKAWKAI
jgi:hypothetical protein